MRINKYIAHNSNYSRREVDRKISEGRVKVNNRVIEIGYLIQAKDSVTIDGHLITPKKYTLLALNKPIGYVCSKKGQGAKTIYELLPNIYSNLKSIGRLDKESSGLLLLTNDGDLANYLLHPKNIKEKVYHIRLDKNLVKKDQERIKAGIELNDGLSKFKIQMNNNYLSVKLHEGRNRQIRRTFKVLGYKVTYLHRVQFGPYNLGNIASGSYQLIEEKSLNS